MDQDPLYCVQDELNKIDRASELETLARQVKFDRQKDSLYGKRGKLLAQVPHIWPEVFRQARLISTSEVAFGTYDHLKDVKLVEGLDEFGSFKAELIFDRASLFRPTVWTREVYFDAEAKEIEAKKVVTKLTFLFASSEDGDKVEENVEVDVVENADDPEALTNWFVSSNPKYTKIGDRLHMVWKKPLDQIASHSDPYY